MKDTPDTTFIERSIQRKESNTLPEWREAKKKLILQALLRNEGKPTAAARELNISRSQMWRYRKAFGLV